jgi:pSer/pThr/pTyr-binding forkhead associated (FHA) protein
METSAAPRIEEGIMDLEEQYTWKVLVVDGGAKSKPREVWLPTESTVRIGRNPPGPHDIRINPACTFVSRDHGEIVTRTVYESLECFFRDTGSLRGSYKIEDEHGTRIPRGRREDYPINDGMTIRLGGDTKSEKTCDLTFVKVPIPKTERY